ncbi:MAG TPA: S8 family serine peptidase [Ferruginibacter sp.]|nr:serine protease [Chitinophagaceae bacterium]HRI24707.1 S8 family serine peptidase [Ferruginibacter sp.]
MNGEKIICPLCHDAVDELVYRFHHNSEKAVIDRIRENNPSWAEQDGICSRCIDYYHVEIIREQKMLPEIGPFFPVKSADDFVILPTALRMDANPKYTGKGVTICFIDSGFYLHPDLVKTTNRIKKIVDITKPRTHATYFSKPHSESWHGTMTSVVCAGDGYLSSGLYKGIASDASLVLLKVMDEQGRISTSTISKALQWVLKHHKQYNIKVVNMSLGDDATGSWKDSQVDVLAEKLVDKGVVIVAAVGNDDKAAIKPPANSPNVIAVGGCDDNNQLDGEHKLYHSSFGKTEDAFHKPELIAHAIWVAAPILPGTKEQELAGALYELENTPDSGLKKKISTLAGKTGFEREEIEKNDVTFWREKIRRRIQECKFISPFYMHVDGTSFAAPVVTSVIAQMLEINPELTPEQVRKLLFSTAKRLPGLPAEQQGYGVIHPGKAIVKTLQNLFAMKQHHSPYINKRKKAIEFYIQNPCASHISLAGSFNHWAHDALLMEPSANGMWKVEIPMLPKGTYQYKFFVDDKTWLEDIDNPRREPDGLNGFNSILMVEN